MYVDLERLRALESGVSLHYAEDFSRGTGRLVGFAVGSASHIHHVLLQGIRLAPISLLPQDRG